MKATLFAVILGLAQFASAGVNYSSQVEFSTSVSQIQITDARYVLVPTKTIVREKPGCDPYADLTPFCSETIVLERQPAVQVYISYVESAYFNDGHPSYTSIYLPLSAFSSEDIATLKSAASKNGFTKAHGRFAKKSLALNITKMKKGVQIVDLKNSTICPLDENMNADFRCVEELAYKTIQSPILLATVIVK